MKVAKLREFVENVAQFLTQSGGTQVGRELHRAADALRPFDERTIAEFESFLKRADQFDRTGQVPAATRTRSRQAAVTDQAKVAQAAETVRQLYEQATDPAVTYQRIDTEVARLNRALNKGEVLAVAEKLGIALPKRASKKATLEEIGRWITERKRSFERTSF